jgi:hypothetical protein
LLSPATITENGLELDCVIGLPNTGDQGEVDMGMEPDDDEIKYCPGLGARYVQIGSDIMYRRWQKEQRTHHGLAHTI